MKKTDQSSVDGMEVRFHFPTINSRLLSNRASFTPLEKRKTAAPAPKNIWESTKDAMIVSVK